MGMISVIIVTHDSQRVLGQCLTALQKQTVKPDSVSLVDSGSTDQQYLQQYKDTGMVSAVLFEKNIGFASANNVGYQKVNPLSDYVLFLNPDAFLTPDCLERTVTFLMENKGVGCVSGRLVGFDWKSQQATGRLDSSGVFRKWYGRWYDRGQGEPDDKQYCTQEDVPAACGAFLFCRKKMLDQVALVEGVIFDPDFFLYKEDIELCLRIQKSDWRIVYLPDILVYHCRGWQKRQQVSYQLRLTAAASELLLYRKHPSPYILWALTKYVLVRWMRV